MPEDRLKDYDYIQYILKDFVTIIPINDFDIVDKMYFGSNKPDKFDSIDDMENYLKAFRRSLHIESKISEVGVGRIQIRIHYFMDPHFFVYESLSLEECLIVDFIRTSVKRSMCDRVLEELKEAERYYWEKSTACLGE